jgi:hypothetical protein
MPYVPPQALVTPVRIGVDQPRLSQGDQLPALALG